MANEYATVTDAVARSSGLANFDAVELEAILEAASRWIDGYCGRRFWLDDTVTVRVFAARDRYVLDLGEHEIGVATGVTVKIDDGTGTFATTVSSSSYQLEPRNAAYAATGARPYTSLRTIDTTWPRACSQQGRQELVQVTARYGWPSVPAAVREACLAMAIHEAENPTSVRSESIDGYSVSYGSSLLAEATGGPSSALLRRLQPYRRSWAV
jgi:hypothetical protein